MTPQQAQILLEKYRRNECTPDEKVALDRWFDELGTDLPPLLFIDDQERDQVRLRVWSHITDRIREPSSVRRISFERQLSWAWRVAATLLIVMGLGWLSIRFSQPSGPLKSEVAQVVVASRAGAHRQLVLPDGSVVYLNGASSLRYPVRFEGSIRPVYLQGEAFFKVAKDPHRPFTVWAGGLATTALGTAFNIRVRPGDNTRVSLVEGKVRIQPVTNRQKKSWLLTPGHQLTYQPQSRTGTVRSFSASSALAWRDRKLLFENEPLDEVLHEISQQYGVIIRFEAKTLHNCRITTQFDLRNPVEDAFRVLSFSHRLTIQHQATGFVVTGAACSP